MEKITFNELRKKSSLLEWFLVHTSVKYDTTDEIVKNVDPETKEFSISLRVNGVELPLFEAFEEIQRQMDEMVAKKARDLLKEKFYDFEDFMHQLQDQIITQVSEKFGIHYEKEW